MDLARVRAHFDEEASAYDAQILRIVPQYLEQGELILDVLPFDTIRAIRALDLGCHFRRLNFAVFGGRKP